MTDTLPESYARQPSLVIKRKVIVHVTFIKIGEIDTLKEAFEADVLLRSKWREPELDDKQKALTADLRTFWNPKIFIDNAIGEAKMKVNLTVEVNDAGEAYLVERRRITGKFMEQLELWEFPFDVQDLSVCLMSDLDTVEVEMVEDPSEIHRIYKQSFIDEQEWYLYKYIESVRSELPLDRGDPNLMRCTLTVRCRAARRPAYFMWNIFSVTFLICCLAFVTFSVVPTKTENRLQLSFTLVLTAVAFKFVVNQCLPKVSYLTYLDRYVLVAMVLLASVCMWHAILSLIPDDVKSLCDHSAVGCFCSMYALYNVVFWAKILIKPYRKRREMKTKESKYMKAVLHQAQESRQGKPTTPDEHPPQEHHSLLQMPALEVKTNTTEETVREQVAKKHNRLQTLRRQLRKRASTWGSSVNSNVIENTATKNGTIDDITDPSDVVVASLMEGPGCDV